MKKDSLSNMKMIYNNRVNESQHKDVLSAVGGSVGQGLEVKAMDRLNEFVSRRKHVQDVGADQGLVQSPFCYCA